ncbi:hypothetical protein SPRG_13864 [Saprolegnia parasitica CBS 223.65]|uniref:Esterase n=1 Tax=Saprolegnia parasitica (strain CBS 223.65) TaxID=695850 RepID=A0A067C3D8_SAPPC|nr:hypothetical protein SPRG_13864 [Saprolegnia parasitica CBS 223.65]KDO21071.1 hypothetical protein SPRG_13864 [Saprolegnia parasitica CBS 223.65]|eukprot:XP_012208250.1 hypothetical protein SPRG_13864 [Saprolegnia parasitica CBS 223.65]
MFSVLDQIAPAAIARRPRNYYAVPETCPFAATPGISFEIALPNETMVLGDSRVFLIFGATASPKDGMTSAQSAFFAQDVANVRSITFDAAAFSVPGALGFLPPSLGGWTADNCFVQAFINANPLDPDPMTCVGNLYSVPTRLDWSRLCADAPTTLTLLATETVHATIEPPTSEFLHKMTITSRLLTAHHGRCIEMMAAITLPPQYDPAIAYPTVYTIEGFGGTETYLQRAYAFLESDMGLRWQSGTWPEVPMLRIVLGSRMTYGHTSFADSETNGPWATALITELLPAIEAKYPSHGRYLMGHSSGGWSTLWLQLQYPSVFDGTWSSAPDPVDFTCFQLANIYEDDNIYWDSYGRQVPMSRELPWLTAKLANQIEWVYGRANGGQWDAFPAIFSPRRSDGTPAPLFDKVTGDIDRGVAHTWKRFDICRLLQAQPELLSTTLAGKVHVVCGRDDTYYLDRACRKLQGLVHAPASEASGNYVRMVPGNHSTIKTQTLFDGFFAEMVAAHRQQYGSM